MKALFTTLTVLCGLALLAQSPEAINYQAVARDGSGQVMANENITVRFTLKQGGATGTIVYQETHTLTTNGFGLFTAAIGLGTPATGTFGNINWGNASHFVQVEVNAGAGYLDMGTTQLLSVPYALYAKEAGNTGGTTYQAGSGIDITGNTISNTAPDQPVTLTGSGATQVSGTYPAFTVSSTDSDNQTLSISGSNLSISGGNMVTLPASGGTITGVTAGTGLTGGGSSGTVTLNAQTTSPLWNAGQIQGRNVAPTAPAADQVLKWNNANQQWQPANDIGGGTGDNWGTQVVQSNATLGGDGTNGNPLGIAQQGATSGQVLKWNGSAWVPANDIGGGAGDNWGTQVVQSNATLSGDGTSTSPLQLAPQGASSGQILKWSGSAWIPATDENTTDTSHWEKSGNYVYLLTDSVGIGVAVPLTGLHLKEGEDVLFGAVLSGSSTARMVWNAGKGALRAGRVTNNNWNNDSIGLHSLATGFNTKATGNYTTAMGQNASATGNTATAIGGTAIASGDFATALGQSAKATGNVSIAIGNNPTASGFSSVAIGTSTFAESGYEQVTGRWNTDYSPLAANDWDAGDRLFTIGNGTASNARSDAMVVLKNGKTGIMVSIPLAGLHVKQGEDVLFGATMTDLSNPRMMWIASMGAFRAGMAQGPSWDIDSIGFRSVAFGFNTTAIGAYTTALGWVTTARGSNSTAMGHYTTASGSNSTAMGSNSTASGGTSTAMGSGTLASGTNSTAMGNNTTASFSNSTAMGVNTTASGESSTAMGEGTTASGARSIAMGYNTTASGGISTAMGFNTIASGTRSVAMGENTSASESYSTAMGRSTTASGSYSTAMGENTTASGSRSTAMGAYTIARSGYETVLGRYNSDYTPSSTTGWNVNDRLFVLGIGTSSVSRKSALIVLKNGKTAIGNITPQTTLHVYHDNVISGNAMIEGLRIEHSGNNSHHWTLYTANSNGYLYLYTKNGGTNSVGNFNANTGVYSSSSNRHLKDGITLLDAGTLAKVLQLEPTKYYFKRDPDQVNTLGFIAEDVQPLFPELVSPTGEEGDGLSINYAGFAVVAIKAIQELEERVRRLEQELEAQKSK